MTGHRPTARLSALFVCLACALVLPHARSQPLDNGIDPARLGKGDWIYSIHTATNKLGGSVPGVTSVPSLMAYYKSLDLQFIVVKAGTGSTNFNNQFDSNLVYAAHAAGLKIFGYTRSFGVDVPGEIDLAARVYALGADGFVIDAEAEWESSHLGTNGPALALQLCQGIKARYPTRFLAHAPFPIISFHPTFPFKEFGLYCDAVMPQNYWKKIRSLDGQVLTPENMVARMSLEWRHWQNSLSGIFTNAVKPIAPIAQAWNVSGTDTTTSAQVIGFVNALKADPNPASRGGYNGVSFWRADLHTPEIWSAIGSAKMGVSIVPALAQPQVAPATGTTSASSSPILNGLPTAFHQNPNQFNGRHPFTTNIIVDNASAQFSGTWKLASSSADKYAQDYRYASSVAGAPTGIAAFTPNLPFTGYYSVYMWYPQGANRPSNVPVSLISPGGATNLVVNQTIHGGSWHLLAPRLYMPAGSACTVQISNNVGYTGKMVMADAVQFVYESPQDSPTDVSMLEWWAQNSSPMSR